EAAADRSARELRSRADAGSWPKMVSKKDGSMAPIDEEESSVSGNGSGNAMLTIDGRRYELLPVDEAEQDQEPTHALVGFQNGLGDSVELDSGGVIQEIEPYAFPIDQEEIVVEPMEYRNVDVSMSANVIDMNLPSALASVGGQHPAVGLAQWRVKEAYARLAQAEVLWLPSIQSGLSFHRHDGNYQASDGRIVDVNRNSFQFGLGTGATGAGTTPRPGLVARFHLADAIFQPRVAEKNAWARGHAAKAILNEQLLRAAIAYMDLLNAHQEVRILEASRERTSQLARITEDFSEAGEGLQADADRLMTELSLVDNRLVAARGEIGLASARLSQAISLEADAEIAPTDVAALPLELVDVFVDKASLIGTGLATRPELKESQSLVAAACQAHQRERLAPFIPSVLLGYSTSGFGGGLGNHLNNVDERYDLDAVVSWEIRNLGLGEKAVRRETASQVQQAKFEKLQVMDQVALEVSEAFTQIRFRREQIAITQRAIETAQQSYDSNMDRIRDGEGLPIEVLQAVQALELAKRAYLTAVVEFNRAQFRLQWALGWPVTTPRGASGVPTPM
ncbi:MAG: TolC family protein, partial [Planctomycetota bacterium]